ncbi:MAG: 50S ribosomal protein L3 [Deltaproteobacteria bacterium]|nr:50S ribosomal protein L3 [Deltaproteobacteria bacterium]
MIEGLLCKKIGMTRIFIEGAEVPVTAIQASDCHVTQKKVKEKDGYDAVQLGLSTKKEKATPKAMQGHFKKAGTPPLRHLAEFGGDSLDEYKAGQKIEPSAVFKAGDIVDVRGVSKGKGFMGVMRRHNFSGGAESHGSMFNRAPGSIGSSSYPSRVFKGMRMGGHMGDAPVTVQNLKIVGVKDDVLLVKGAVPGAVGAIVMVKKASKKK